VSEQRRSWLVPSRGFCEKEQQECHIRADEQAEDEGHSRLPLLSERDCGQRQKQRRNREDRKAEVEDGDNHKAEVVSASGRRLVFAANLLMDSCQTWRRNRGGNRAVMASNTTGETG